MGNHAFGQRSVDRAIEPCLIQIRQLRERQRLSISEYLLFNIDLLYLTRHHTGLEL